jgi:hypothetical protein
MEKIRPSSNEQDNQDNERQQQAPQHLLAREFHFRSDAD